MNDVDRAECERVWELANDAFFKQQEKTGDGHGAAIPLLLAAKRKWENAKLDEAAQRCTKQAQYYRDNGLYPAYCLNGMESGAVACADVIPLLKQE